MEKPSKEIIAKLEAEHDDVYVASSEKEGQWYYVCRLPTYPEAKRHRAILAQDPSEGNLSLIQKIGIWPSQPDVARLLNKYPFGPDGIVAGYGFKRFVGRDVKTGIAEPSDEFIAWRAKAAIDADDTIDLSSSVAGQWGMVLERPDRSTAQQYKKAINRDDPEASVKLVRKIAIWPHKEAVEKHIERYPFLCDGITAHKDFLDFIGYSADSSEK